MLEPGPSRLRGSGRPRSQLSSPRVAATGEDSRAGREGGRGPGLTGEWRRGEPEAVLGARAKGRGKRERLTRVWPHLGGHTHLGYPASPRLGTSSALLPRCACWASGRPQVSLATTLRHAPRAPLPRTAPAPSGQTEGQEGMDGGRARGRRAESQHLSCLENWGRGGVGLFFFFFKVQRIYARAALVARWNSAGRILGTVVLQLMAPFWESTIQFILPLDSL